MEMLKDRYPELGEIPRPDKAYVYLVTNEDIKDLKLNKNNIDKNLDTILSFVKEQFEYDIEDRRLDARETNFIIRKGDMVYIEPLLNGNNKGKYIYLEHDLIPLNIDKYVLPEEIQVILDVPINYYDGRIGNNTYVPFNFKKNIGIITEDNVLRQRRFPYFKFQRNGETYIIAADYMSKNEDISNTEFLKYLNIMKYGSSKPIESKGDYLRLGDWRNIIYLPIKT
jgi:hypothetical protein